MTVYSSQMKRRATTTNFATRMADGSAMPRGAAKLRCVNVQVLRSKVHARHFESEAKMSPTIPFNHFRLPRAGITERELVS